VCYICRMTRLLIATHNPGKQREYEALLAKPAIGLALCWPQELGLTLNVSESGATYTDNARLKALAYAEASALWTLADDSGLEVDALNGAPGPHSARYGGRAMSDADRYQLVLRQLEGVPLPRRSARFRCVVVLATPSGQTYAAEGLCEGLIALQARGEQGFGYDPIFYLPGYERTMAELPGEVKNRISHRARAVESILPTLKRLVRESLGGAQAWER